MLPKEKIRDAPGGEEQNNQNATRNSSKRAPAPELSFAKNT